MSYQTIKWILFTVLFLTVPAMLFLVQAIMFIPAIFFLAAIAYVIPKVFVLGHAMESLWFILFLSVHFLVYGGAYYIVSVLAAKIITMIRASLVRNCTVGVLCLGLGSLTQFSIYGGGGHGPMHWETLWEVLKGINQSYGAGTVEIVYGVTLLLLSVFLLYRKLRVNRSVWKKGDATLFGDTISYAKTSEGSICRSSTSHKSARKQTRRCVFY